MKTREDSQRLVKTRKTHETREDLQDSLAQKMKNCLIYNFRHLDAQKCSHVHSPNGRIFLIVKKKKEMKQRRLTISA